MNDKKTTLAWADPHIIAAFFQPFILVAMQSAPPKVQPWVGALYAGLMAVGLITGRAKQGPISFTGEAK